MELSIFVIATIFIVPATALLMIGTLIAMYINDKVKNKEKLKAGSIIGFATGILCIIVGASADAYILIKCIMYLVQMSN